MRKHTTQKWSFRIAYREIVSILWFLSILVASIDKHNIEKICLYSVLHFSCSLIRALPTLERIAASGAPELLGPKRPFRSSL